MKQILFISFILLSTFSSAQRVVELYDNAPKKHITEVSVQNVRIYKDSTSALTPKQVFLKEFNLTYIDYKENPDWKTSAFWSKFTVKNNSSNERWLLEIPDFHIQKVAFYSVSEDSIQEAGYLELFSKRHYEHKNFVYNLNIPPKQERTFLVKMCSSRGFGTGMKIYSNDTFVSYATKEYILLGFFYGFLILNAFYNFFMYVSIRDKAHIFYFLYILSIGLRSLLEDGLGFQFFWPEKPELNSVFSTLSPILLLVTFAIYSSIFLELRSKFMRYFKYLIGSVVLYFVYYFVNIFFADSNYSDFVYVIPFMVIYMISILVYKEGYKPARFFVLGYSLFILSLLIFYLRSVGLAPSFGSNLYILLIVYSFNIGFAVEAFVFSLSLSDKIKIFKKENDKTQQEIISQLKINEELKDKVNRELELKVVERTTDLAEQSNLLKLANEKLQHQAEEINKMNQLLDLENYKLKTSVKDINKDRGLLKAITIEEFVKAFPDESACYRFIEELKWGNGYKCKKCGNEKFMKGKVPFYRKCTKCTYNESIKSNTIFHDIKFPIEKAFQIIYLTLANEGEVSTYELASKLDLRQKTCWSFRKRILDKIKKEKISNKDIHEKGWSMIICDEVG